MTTATETEWTHTSRGHDLTAYQAARIQEAIGDANPLFSDAETARRHGYRDAVAPPMMVDSFNCFYAGEPLPIAREYPYEFSGSDTYELHEAICVGDVVDAHARIRNIDDRLRGNGTDRIRIVEYEKRYVDSATDRPLATAVWTYVNFEGNPTASSPPAFVPPTDAGEEIPSVVDTLDMVKIVKWSGAMGDWALLHIDYPLVTQERGLKDVIGHGPRTTALLTRALTDWLGTDGRIARLAVRYRTNTYPKDELTTRIWVRPGADATSLRRFDATMALVNQDGIAVTTGTAVLER